MSLCEKCKNAKTCPYSKYNFDEKFFDCDDYGKTWSLDKKELEK